MHKTMIAALAAALMGMGIAGNAMAADEKVVVVDEPDLRTLNKTDQRTRLNDLVGMDVYSNNGTRIGEVEDFVLARGGYLYAVVNYQDGPLESLIEFTEEGDAVVPWDELRVSNTATLGMNK